MLEVILLLAAVALFYLAWSNTRKNNIKLHTQVVPMKLGRVEDEHVQALLEFILQQIDDEPGINHFDVDVIKGDRWPRYEMIIPLKVLKSIKQDNPHLMSFVSEVGKPIEKGSVYFPEKDKINQLHPEDFTRSIQSSIRQMIESGDSSGVSFRIAREPFSVVRAQNGKQQLPPLTEVTAWTSGGSQASVAPQTKLDTRSRIGAIFQVSEILMQPSQQNDQAHGTSGTSDTSPSKSGLVVTRGQADGADAIFFALGRDDDGSEVQFGIARQQKNDGSLFICDSEADRRGLTLMNCITDVNVGMPIIVATDDDQLVHKIVESVPAFRVQDILYWRSGEQPLGGFNNLSLNPASAANQYSGSISINEVENTTLLPIIILHFDPYSQSSNLYDMQRLSIALGDRIGAGLPANIQMYSNFNNGAPSSSTAMDQVRGMLTTVSKSFIGTTSLECISHQQWDSAPGPRIVGASGIQILGYSALAPTQHAVGHRQLSAGQVAVVDPSGNSPAIEGQLLSI